MALGSIKSWVMASAPVPLEVETALAMLDALRTWPYEETWEDGMRIVTDRWVSARRLLTFVQEEDEELRARWVRAPGTPEELGRRLAQALTDLHDGGYLLLAGSTDMAHLGPMRHWVGWIPVPMGWELRLP